MCLSNFSSSDCTWFDGGGLVIPSSTTLVGMTLGIRHLILPDEEECRNRKSSCRELEDEQGANRDCKTLGGGLVELEEDGGEEVRSFDNNNWGWR
ncbi:hypothetical protein LIER_12089 [Lithospermum erythrorhizon]|uniref:Uncharacterized protein n=1 Tax=Lithospermum erythrorhizon TaxID=34254 RepID=A0AAV3PUH5_LITER